VKLKDLPYFLGLRPEPQTYTHKLKTFELATDGTIQYAQWLHPSETEKEITQQSVDALRKFLSPADVAIDIGAHTGDSTVPMALAVGKTGCVLALEPNRYVFPVLKQNAELNLEKTTIVPLMFAATAEDAELQFQYSDSGFCNGGRYEGISKWVHGKAFTLTVQGRNVQSLLQEYYPQALARIRYIKIDTEGYDAAVLQSLAGLISQRKPFLKVEVYNKLNDRQRRALYRLIAQWGYVIRKFASDDDYFGEILLEGDLSKWRHFDIFCVPTG
jgi:FkbM family methyltransferase